MAALKKKGSAISLFSGLSISTVLSDPPDPTPDKPSEDHRRYDTGGSLKGREASQFGLPEDELDGKWSTAGSDSASSAGSKHISLGKCAWQFELVVAYILVALVRVICLLPDLVVSMFI